MLSDSLPGAPSTWRCTFTRSASHATEGAGSIPGSGGRERVAAVRTRPSSAVTVDEVRTATPEQLPRTEDLGSDALRVLYDDYSAELWRYVFRLTRDAHQAHDVVQETLIRAWRHPEITGEGSRSPRAWLFTVARNIVIDDRRSARFRIEVAMPQGADSHEPIDPHDTNTTVDRLIVRQALAQLTVDHRAVLWRSYYLGWTLARIAEDLQIAEGTVKSRLHYALRALRRTLQHGREADDG
jgi:RNA polymerase sigma-70 factor, ECF subfamily